MDGLAAVSIPGDDGLALVVQASTDDDVGTIEATLDVGEQFARVVLDPAGLRIDLVVLDRTERLEVAVRAQPVRFGGRRALVDANDERRHESVTSDE